MSTILRRFVQQTTLNNSRKNVQYYLQLYCSSENTINKDKFDKIVNNNKVVVFMKGNPEAPRCGFSNAVVQILRMHGVQYDSVDVLENEEIRQGIKEYSNWPTIPQVFLKGEFVGGCDILLQMHQSGDLIEELEKCGIISALKLSADSDKDDDKKK